ncbi:MAG: DUF503 domain-containing protein [Chloroflexota bacterium]
MLHIGLLTLQIQLPGCTSLKEKRSRLKPLLARLHREFNVSAAEVGDMDAWQRSVLACTLVSNDAAFAQRALQKVTDWLEMHWPDVSLVEERIEVLH